MIFLLFRLLGSFFSGGINACRPKRVYATPKREIITAKWILRYTNQARSRHGLRPLVRQEVLQSAAQGHSNWMARHAFSHTGVRGTSPHQRIEELGFSGGATAENIYKFPARRDRKKLARDLVDGWMKSPGHRANILNGQLRYIGVGVARSGEYIYATQNFGG